MKRLAILILSTMASASVHASPLQDNWTCGASLSLSAIVGTVAASDVDAAEKCAGEYLTWALDYTAKHEQLLDAVKVRHAAFLAYARGQAAPQSVDVRALKTKLEEADARVDVETQAARL